MLLSWSQTRTCRGAGQAGVARATGAAPGDQAGQPIDLLLDTTALRLIGFDIRCGDDVVRFLPVAAARIRPDEIEVRSALLLLDEGDTSFYRRRTRPLRSLRGLALTRDGADIGLLEEVVVAPDGEIISFVLEGGRRIAPTRPPPRATRPPPPEPGTPVATLAAVSARARAVAADARAAGVRTARGLRKPKNWLQLAKFCTVGASGYVVNLAVFAALVKAAGVDYRLAAVCSFVVAVTNNYAWNRHLDVPRQPRAGGHPGRPLLHRGRHRAAREPGRPRGARPARPRRGARAGDRHRDGHADQLRRQQALVVRAPR